MKFKDYLKLLNYVNSIPGFYFYFEKKEVEIFKDKNEKAVYVMVVGNHWVDGVTIMREVFIRDIEFVIMELDDVVKRIKTKTL